MNKQKRQHIIILVVLICISIAVTGSLLLYSGRPNSMLQIRLEPGGIMTVDSPLFANTDKTYRIFWETDAGTLHSPEESGYYCTAQAGETMLWEGEEQDGLLFRSATVRAFLFEERDYALLGFQEYEQAASAELTLLQFPETQHIQETSPRRFGNPVKAEGSADWQEIYPLFESKSEDSDYIILRYRTGNAMQAADSICWETSAAPFSKALYSVVPPYSPAKEVSNKRVLKNADTTCFNRKTFDGFFFTNDPQPENQHEITITAFVAGSSSEKYKSSCKIHIDKILT